MKFVQTIDLFAKNENIKEGEDFFVDNLFCKLFCVGNISELQLYIHSNPTLNNTHVRPQKIVEFMSSEND